MSLPPTDTVCPPPPPPTARPVVKTVACLCGVSLERGVPTDEVREHLRDADNLVWMDVQDPGPEELSMLLEEFGFHPLAIEDVTRDQQRPKVDDYKSYLLVVTHAVIPAADPLDSQTAQVALFVGRNYLVSVHRGKVPAIEEAAARWTRGGQMLKEGIGFLVYNVMDALIDAYLPLIDSIEEEMSAIELELFAEFKTEDVQRLLRMKRSLVALRRVLYPLREAFHVFLRPNHPFFSAATRIYYQDVYDHILRLLDMLDIQREMVNGATDAYLTLTSNRLNVTMKKLTAITVGVAVMAAVFGAWGMNFTKIPLSEHWWGFWTVLIGAIGLTAAAVWVLEKKWL